jgi:hypothetical protein
MSKKMISKLYKDYLSATEGESRAFKAGLGRLWVALGLGALLGRGQPPPLTRRAAAARCSPPLPTAAASHRSCAAAHRSCAATSWISISQEYNYIMSILSTSTSIFIALPMSFNKSHTGHGWNSLPVAFHKSNMKKRALATRRRRAKAVSEGRYPSAGPMGGHF